MAWSSCRRFLQKATTVQCWPKLKTTDRLFNTDVVPRITVPQKMVQKYTKIRLKQASAAHKEKQNFKGPVQISCHRSQYNHHKGQTYSNFSPDHLASRGWKNRRSSGDHFTLNPTSKNPALSMSDEVQDIHSFTDLGLSHETVEALKQFDVTSPTNIQALTIPKAMRGENLMCAAETGSGKTLAFLLPVIEKVIKDKQYTESQNQAAAPNQPCAVVIAPSRELAEQIHSVCCDLALHLPFTSAVVCGGRGTKKLVRNPGLNMMDVLVSTPGVLNKLLVNRIYDMSRLFAVILDEADTLLDDSFNALTIQLLNKLTGMSAASFYHDPVSESFMEHESQESHDVRESHGKEESHDIGESHDVGESHFLNSGLQLIMAAATMPRGQDRILGKTVELGSVHQVTTSHLNRLLTHITQKFCRVAESHKPEMLVRHLKHCMQSSLPTLVFCNRLETLLFLQHILRDNNVDFQSLHSSMNEENRMGRFAQFQRGEVDVLLCTDIASRGLDTIRARHIVNYDFPQFMSDYIHRVGRVGRVGTHGASFALSFVTRPWEVELLWQIEAAARRDTHLHNVNANIKRKLQNLNKIAEAGRGMELT